MIKRTLLFIEQPLHSLISPYLCSYLHYTSSHSLYSKYTGFYMFLEDVYFVSPLSFFIFHSNYLELSFPKFSGLAFSIHWGIHLDIVWKRLPHIKLHSTFLSLFPSYFFLFNNFLVSHKNIRSAMQTVFCFVKCCIFSTRINN